MPSSDLPGEVTDLIIDFLQDDVAALRMCQFAHSSFRPRARFHFFRQVSLSSTNINKFIQLREDTPELISFLRVIRIRGRRDSEDAPRPLAKLLAKVGPYLHKVLTLVLEDTSVGQELARLIPKCLPNLELLHIARCNFEYPHILFCLIAGFPNLSHLKLYNVSFVTRRIHSESIDDAKSTFCSSLESLSLGSGTTLVPLILNGLRDCKRADRITKFRFTDMGRADIRHVQLFLDAAGKGLQHLNVGYNETYNIDESSQDPLLNLSKVSALQRLTFKMTARFPNTRENGDEPGSHPPPVPSRWVPGTLQTVSSEVLKSIQFNIYAGSVYRDDVLTNTSSWEDIVHTMNNLKLSSTSLINVQLASSQPECWRPYASMVKDTLARLGKPLKVTLKTLTQYCYHSYYARGVSAIY